MHADAKLQKHIHVVQHACRPSDKAMLAVLNAICLAEIGFLSSRCLF